MEKKNMVLLTVIAVATLLVAVVGATFAYFTASVSGTGNSQAPSTVTTTKLAGLVFNAEAMVSNGDVGVYPGWVGYQKLTAEGDGDTGAKGKYSLTLTVDSTNGADLVKDVTYTLYRGTGATAPTYAAGTLAQDGNNYSINDASFTAPAGFTAVATDVALASGTIVNSYDFTDTSSDVYYIVYKYNNKTEDQSAAMGQTFTASIKASLNKLS